MPAAPARANDTSEGINAYAAGNFEKALKHFTDAQLDAPDKPESLYNVADAYYKTGNFDAAVEYYEKVLETADKGLKHKTLYNLGNAEYRRSNAKAALDHYEAALAMDPNDRLTRENMEFVKKVLEQQQEKQSGDDQNKPDKNIENQDQQNSSQPDSGRDEKDLKDQQQRDPSEEGGKAEQKHEFGDQINPQQQQQQAAQSGEPKNDQPAAAQPQQAQPGEQTEGTGQAERMLNRLQDQPGRALMPGTDSQRVEKDW
jgi:Ca-activated chloride channel family protein